MRNLNFVFAALLVTTVSPSVHASKCGAGDIVKMNGTTQAILHGYRLINLEDDTTVMIVSTPSSRSPNYEVTAIEISKPMLIGSTTKFNECNSNNCKTGMSVTLGQDATGIVRGSQLVYLNQGSLVKILNVPSSISLNYEIALMKQSESLLVGANAQFKGCE